jgi:hypothetical protein
MKISRWHFLVVMVLGTGSVWAANHYVRQGASGIGNDWTNAYGALPATLVRGDTYYIADGTYGAYEFKTNNSGTSAVYIKKAIAADHGTDTGWDADYGDGEALFSSTGIVWQFGPGTGYYTISGQKGTENTAGSYGFRLYTSASRNSAGALLKPNTNGTWAETGNHANVTLQYIEFDWNNGTAAGDSGATRAIDFNSANANPNFTVSHCYVHHSSGFGFYLGGIGSNLTIDHCCFEANGGSTVYHHETLWITSLNGLTFSNNVIKDTKAGALTGWLMLGAVSDARIYNNVFTCSAPTSAIYSCGGNGIIATWDNGVYKNTNIEIVHNTFVDLPSSGNTAIYFYHSDGSDDSDVVCKNNLYFNTRFSWTGIDTQSSEACGGGQSCAGINQQTGIDPSIFSDYTNDDFRLNGATAPGVSTAYTLDRLGMVRGADGNIDRGAYEYTATEIRRMKEEIRNKNQVKWIILPNPVAISELSRHLQDNNMLVYDLTGKELVVGSLKQPGIYMLRGREGGVFHKTVIIK